MEPAEPKNAGARKRAEAKERARREAAQRAAIRAAIEAVLDRVGVDPDEVVAEKAGVHPSDVVRYRVKRFVAAPGTVPPLSGKPGKRDWQVDPYSDLVGRLPDARVAERAGVGKRVVRGYREARGIPELPEAPAPPAPSRGRKSKIDPVAELVGVLTDREVAERAGVPLNAVRAWRKRRGLPAAPNEPAKFARVRPHRGSGSRLDAHRDIIGVLPDHQVAAHVGVSRALVHAYRKKHGIPGPGRVPRPPKPPAPKEPRRTKPSRLDAHREQIGVLSDGEVAKRAGLTRAAVKAYRTRHGIPPSRPWAGHLKAKAGAAPASVTLAPTAVLEAPERRPGGRRSKIDAVRELVGVLTDGDVAKRVGVTVSAVHMYRRARGIPPAVPRGHHGPGTAVAVRTVEPSTAAPAPAPAPVARPAPSRGVTTWGWRLTLATAAGEITRYAVAADAGAACALADGAGDVVGVVRLGEGF